MLEIDTGAPVYFRWLENFTIDADGHPSGVDLRQLTHSAVRDVTVKREATLVLRPQPTYTSTSRVARSPT